MTDIATKVPWHLYAIGVFAVLFNAIGVFDFTMTMVQGTAYLASAGMSAEQVAYYDLMPFWILIIWAVGVFGAFIASILLLLRKKLALQIFLVSIAAYVVNLFHTYVMTAGGTIMGRQNAIASMVIFSLLAGFCTYAWRMSNRAVLR